MLMNQTMTLPAVLAPGQAPTSRSFSEILGNAVRAHTDTPAFDTAMLAPFDGVFFRVFMEAQTAGVLYAQVRNHTKRESETVQIVLQVQAVPNAPGQTFYFGESTRTQLRFGRGDRLSLGLATESEIGNLNPGWQLMAL